MLCVDEIPFIIPRQLKDVHEHPSADFERIRLMIRRMDEYLLSPEDHSEAKRKRHQDTSVGLQALVAATNKIEKVAFREILSVDETLPAGSRRTSGESTSVDSLLRQSEKVDPITDFREAHDFIEFDVELAKHRKDLSKKQATKPSDMLYLKLCLILELQRDESESCLRILLHDIIFKFHLMDFRLRCEIHVRKPIENELVLEKIVHGSHLDSNYSAQFILYSGDWIVQQEVELYVVMKVESLSINKYIGPKFWDMAHLHVKNVPHGASRIFLRELTPVSRPHKIVSSDGDVDRTLERLSLSELQLSRGINVGQVEIEASFSSTQNQLLIHIVKVSHSQAERLLRAPGTVRMIGLLLTLNGCLSLETYVEVIFQGPFDIYDIQRTKVADRSLNPKFDEEFLFDIPAKAALSDFTVDLIFLEKSSLHQPAVLGVLTLSKHTDWFPVRKFWADLEENPEIKLKNSFLFEGNVED